MNRRGFERRLIDARCTIRYLAPDGQTVLEVVGTTIDVSRGGLGILVGVSLRRGTPVHLSILGQDGKVTNLTGEIRFTRQINSACNSVGVRFRKLTDDRLTPTSQPADTSDSDPRPPAQEAGVRNE